MVMNRTNDCAATSAFDFQLEGPTTAAGFVEAAADVPRAMIPPDRGRSHRGRAPTYRSASFRIVGGALEVLDPLSAQAPHASDGLLCALVIGVLRKYHREDRLVVGVMTSTAARGYPAVFPVVLECASTMGVAQLSEILTDVIARFAALAEPEFERLARQAALAPGESRCPYFDVAILTGRTATSIDISAYPVDACFRLEVAGSDIMGRVDYLESLFDPGTIHRIVGHLISIAHHAGKDPQRALRDTDLLSEKERSQILAFSTGRQVAFPLHRTLHGLFEDQVVRTPDHVAAIHGAESITYDSLNRRANRIAHLLTGRRLHRGEFVGVLLPRGIDFLAAILGVMKAGGAYVPLDPGYPRDRVVYMLADSQARCVISSVPLLSAYAEKLATLAPVPHVVCLDTAVPAAVDTRPPFRWSYGCDTLALAPTHNPEVAVNGRDRAYMIYTSGSSGRPKGAICRHDGALNHLFGELDELGVTGPFRFLQTAPSSSDISVWQFIAPLLFGGATVIVNRDDVVDPDRLLAEIRIHCVTLVEPVPSVLRAVLDYLDGSAGRAVALPDLRFMMCSGEALPTELADRWFVRYPNIPLANTYGPTEASDDITLAILHGALTDAPASVPIGRPLPNLTVAVLDPDMQLLPCGIPGEICVAGVGVGEGYWRQEERSRTAFVTCTLPGLGETGVYRTGDLGRWLTSGALEFLGRIDQQIKIRGHRVEPGEVEALLNDHPAISEAVVVSTRDTRGAHQLGAVYTLRPWQDAKPRDIRIHLANTLPEHMLPSWLVETGTIPRTPMGKVDRIAIAEMRPADRVGPNLAESRADSTETKLMASWEDALGRTGIGLDEDFFEIGGDSLLTLLVCEAAAKRGIKVRPWQIFRNPTISRLVASLGPQAAADNPTPAAVAEPVMDDMVWKALSTQVSSPLADSDDAYPLSPAQHDMYFQMLLIPRTAGVYVEQVAFDIEGDLDVPAFAAAWQEVVRSTEVLRTGFARLRRGEPVQFVVRSARVEVAVLKPSGLSADDWSRYWDRLQYEDRQQGFDLRRPPLARVTVVQRGSNSWRVLWTYHHLILDGWSEALVLKDVLLAYADKGAQRERRNVPITRYRDVVRWRRSGIRDETRCFWRTRLSKFQPPPPIQGEIVEHAVPGLDEPSHGEMSYRLSGAEREQWDRYRRSHGVTESAITHAAWALLLHRRTQSDDVAFGAVSAGRHIALPGIREVRGLVISTLPYRSRLEPDSAALPWVRSVQDQLAEMWEFDDAPVSAIQEWCQPSTARRALFETCVINGHYAGTSPAFWAVLGENLRLGGFALRTQPPYALSLVILQGEEPALRLVYDARRFSARYVARLLDEYLALVRAMVSGASCRVRDLIEVFP